MHGSYAQIVALDLGKFNIVCGLFNPAASQRYLEDAGAGRHRRAQSFFPSPRARIFLSVNAVCEAGKAIRLQVRR
jgi:hypothetical protein